MPEESSNSAGQPLGVLSPAQPASARMTEAEDCSSGARCEVRAGANDAYVVPAGLG